MNTIGERIKEKRKSLNITQKQLAACIGIKASAVTQWEGNITKPSGENLLKLAEALNSPPEVFTNSYSPAGKKPHLHKVAEKANSYILPNHGMILSTIRVPIISDIAAGVWKESMDSFYPGEAEHWQETTAKVSEKSFALRVEGKSMQNPNGLPSIPHGSIVIVDPELEALSGSIVVAKLPETNRTTIKRLVIDGRDTFLEPLNPDYKPILVDDNCVIVGVVKQVIQDI